MEPFGLEKQLSQILQSKVLLAFGANISGAWGSPRETLFEALGRLCERHFKITALSSTYTTKGYGQIRQPNYVNLVAAAQCALSPRQIISIAKELERCAGRRQLGLNAPRPLDIDLLDYKGRTINWRPARHRPKLVLPHPLMVDRAFVLVPLAEVMPNWRHPVLQLTARQMLNRLGGGGPVLLRREIYRVDSPLLPCDL